MSIVIRKENEKIRVKQLKRKFIADEEAIKDYIATTYGEAA
jgi:hypothetical protein